MARSLWLFNLFLAVLAVVLVWVLGDSLSDRRPAGSRQDGAGSGQRAAAQASEAEGPAPQIQTSVPPLADFDVIVAKDAFKNPFAAVPRPPVAPPPPPLPPLPSLVGTIFIGEERKAILSSNNRIQIYTVGQPVAGGTLVKVEADRVVIERAGTSAEVRLRASIQPVRGPAPSGAAAPAPPKTGPPENGKKSGEVSTSVPPPQNAPQTGARPTARERWEERMRQLMERRTQQQSR